MHVRADLHTHTARSDGLLEPARLVQAALDAGLTVLAVTDHDSVAGLREAAQAAQEHGIELVPGIELSMRDAHGVDDHLLGLWIDPRAAHLRARLDRLQAERRDMAAETLDALAALGLPISRDRVDELAAGAVVTRPHIARAMVEAGYVATEQEAFDRYLGSGKPAAPLRPALSPEEAIQLVRNAGGVAALAHPVFSQDPRCAERLAGLGHRLDRLRDLGLHAIECFYPDATAAITDQLLTLARGRDLLATGGSDYHGPGKAPFSPLGVPSVDSQIVHALRAVISSAQPGRPESRT